jgi:glycosyltransferase involved in cell wall biosynthesis
MLHCPQPHFPGDSMYMRTDRADVDLINNSPLFDEQFYARESGLPCDRLALIDHYLMKGEAENKRPSLLFDPSFYRLSNPDVERAGIQLLTHYLQYGSAEGRYPTRQKLSMDARTLLSSGLFDAKFYARRFPQKLLPNASGAEQYLAFWRLGHRCNSEFDEAFYLQAYEDSRRCGRAPILHYIDVGHSQARFVSKRSLIEACEDVRASFDEVFYRAQAAGELNEDEDALEHYFLKGNFRGFRPSQEFDEEFYLLSNLDIQAPGVVPFVHYVRHGAREGRLGRVNVDGLYRDGKRAFSADLPTVLIANHEASRTGAPVVGLNLAKGLSDRFNVISFCGRDGEMSAAFAEVSVRVLTSSAILSHAARVIDAEFILRDLIDRYGLSAVILNSAETDYFAEAALQAGVPSLALIHEFAEYTLPSGRIARAVSYSDRVVVPAKLIGDSLQREVTAICGAPSDNIVIRPQGLLEWLPEDDQGTSYSSAELKAYLQDRFGGGFGEGVHVVLGAGFVQIRKGVDLFIQTAAEMRKLRDDVAFVWVGADNKNDIHYSLWLHQMVERMGLSDRVFFLPTQSSLETILSLTDIFYLSSRLDPFPNVVIDAFNAGKYVVCFKEATGCAEMIENGEVVGAAVDHCDVAAAAQAIAQALDDGSCAAAGANKTLVADKLGFANYVAFLEEELGRAIASRRVLAERVAAIDASGAFDADFFEGHATGRLPAIRSIRRYGAAAAKGLSIHSPRPGFSDHVFRSKHRLAAGEIAMLNAMAAQTPPATHRAIGLASLEAGHGVNASVAVHIHLHYSDLAGEFVTRLSGGVRADLFVTVTSLKGKYEAQYFFANYTGGAVTIVVVPNRGRDIGPFCEGFAGFARAGAYDVVGHFHAKKSLAIGGDAGLRWRTFLLDSLLEPTVTPRLLALFEREPKLGLVFAEDRHCVGWSENRPFAEALSARMEPRPSLPDLPFFPLGTMFWARAAALQPLWRLHLASPDFPPEPAPYDGTPMHALERMLPPICEAAGYTWLTVFNPARSW